MTWGLHDLEFSLERHPDSPFKMVEACMQRVAEQLKSSGSPIAMGTVAPEPEWQK